MSIFKNSLAAFIDTTSLFLSLVNWLSTVAIHLYTVIFIVKVKGFLLGFIAFFMPFLAEIYAIYISYNQSNLLINSFSQYILLYVIYLLTSISFILINNRFRRSNFFHK